MVSDRTNHTDERGIAIFELGNGVEDVMSPPHRAATALFLLLLLTLIDPL